MLSRCVHLFSRSLFHCCSLSLFCLSYFVLLKQQCSRASSQSIIAFYLKCQQCRYFQPDKCRTHTVTASYIQYNCYCFADSFSLTGAPLGVWRKMERGGESPVTQDSPERRGGSPDLSSLPPLGKRGRLDLNGSPNGPRVRHNGASSRPQGGRA